MTTREENAADLARAELAKANEWQIATRIVVDAIKLGYVISVVDDFEGEGDTVVVRSDNALEVLAALRTTEGDMLRFHKEGSRKLIGWVALMWGLGVEVIHDSTVDEATNEIVKGAEALADELEGQE